MMSFRFNSVNEQFNATKQPILFCQFELNEKKYNKCYVYFNWKL